jgi:hypothetical protein
MVNERSLDFRAVLLYLQTRRCSHWLLRRISKNQGSFMFAREQTTSEPSDNVAMINYVKMTGRDALHTDEDTTESRVPTWFRLVTLTGEASNWWALCLAICCDWAGDLKEGYKWAGSK